VKVIILILLVMSLNHLGCKPLEENHHSLQADQSSKDWKLFNFEESEFSISFPEEPKIDKREVESVKGKVTVVTYYVEQPNVSYAVSIAPIPVKINYLSRAKDILDKSRDQTVAQEKGTLLEESDISINDFPGREFSISTSKGIWKDRIYLTGDRIYVVYTFTGRELLDNPVLAQNQTELIRSFFNSFKLTMPSKG
jgi:hypothetical protein